MLLISGDKPMSTFGVELTVRLSRVIANPGTDEFRIAVLTYQRETDTYHELGRSEDVTFRGSDISFGYRCPFNFRFDKLQRIKIIAYILRDVVAIARYGEVIVDLGVVAAQGGHKSLPMARCQCDIEIHVPQFYSQFLRMRFNGAHLHSPEDIPLALYLVITLPVGNRTILLHKSEIIQNNKNPQWVEFSVPLYILHFYNDSSVHIACYNKVVNREDILIGYFTTTLTQLQRGIGSFNSYLLINNDGRRLSEKTGIELKLLELENGPTFFDILAEKTSIHATAAIDFTASNGNPVKETSLHFIHPHRPSAYLKAILDSFPILMEYMPGNNPKIGALGFGANVNLGKGFQLSQCFILNGSTTDHHVLGLTGLVDAYRNATLTVQPFAPTEFSEVIYYISKFAKAESRRRLGIYLVLVIFSDGGPVDSRRTIDALVDASPHPMSVIAIGVGENRDFQPMRVLESANLKHSDGRMLVRQNYIFVEASQLSEDDALGLLPLQMVQWKRSFSNFVN